MSTFKKISLTVNAETGAFIDPVDGSKLNTAGLPDFCLGETSILCLSFVDSSLNAYPFAAEDSFELSVDKDFVHTVNGVEDPLMAYSGDSMFNISGDWDSADLTTGKLSVRINCNTTGFVSKIGSTESVMAWIEIQRYPAGLSDASIILRNKCVTRNSVKITEGSPSSASPDYYTALQINTLIAEAESRVLTIDNETEYTPAADYHPATKKYVDDNAGSGGSTPVGSIQQYIGATEPSGWLLLQGGAIGDASSGAATRANADTETLYTLLWNSMADAQAPVSSGRGATAAADFAAHKTITLPDMRGRAVIGSGTGSGLTARTHGTKGGAETHVLSTTEMPAHSHPLATCYPYTAGGAAPLIPYNNSSSVYSYSNTGSTGSGGAHANMQPWIAINYIIKY